MKVRGYVVAVIIVSSIFAFSCALHADEEAEKSAVAASRAWLSLVDEERYGESWEEAAELFRGAVTKDGWQQTIASVKATFGKTVSRELKSTKYMESLPGAPDGKYVVIQYEASFEHKKSAIETITPMLDRDGTWRVSGYYIK
jgi:hypothetical protein